MSRRSEKSTGRLGVRLALVCGGASLVGAGVLVVLLVQTFASYVPGEHAGVVRQGWLFGALVALVVAGGVALAAYLQGGQIRSRLTDLGLGVSKLGRTGGEVRIRVAGNDEITSLGRALQYLATDLQAMHAELQQSGGSSASLDKQVRELRDKTLDDELAEADGCEVGGAIGAGSRGGLDYFGSVGAKDDTGAVKVAVAYVVSAEGGSAMSVLACRLARDEIVRALEAGATARKALVHTNRTMHGKLPRGVCAKASLIEFADGEAKLYQAGYRAPLWICSAGQVLELAAEGLALGLDAGPVFEKGLRSEKIPMQPGVRLVQTNEAGVRMPDLLELVREHSPKHTMPFVNLVIGALEKDAGGDGLREDVLLLTLKRS